MLKRRNTIHQGHQLYSKDIHPLGPHATTTLRSTNPFLSSSLDDLSTLVSKHSQYAPPFATSNDDEKNNPFYYEPNTCNPFFSQGGANIGENHQQEEYQYPSHDQHNIYPNQQQQQYTLKLQTNSNPKDLHKRKMSVDVFKAPFNLNKARRATCTASDLKRMLTIKTPSALIRRYHKKEDHHGRDNSELVGAGGGSHDYSNGNADEILKTSKYHPEEQFMDNHPNEDQQQPRQHSHNAQEGYSLDNSKESYQYQHQATEESYNPFVQNHNGNHAGHEHGMEIHPFDSAPDQQGTDPYHQQPSFQAPSQPEERKPASPTRRRYSVFSDWSIEDCPRLLAMQQRQQREQQYGEQEYQVHSAKLCTPVWHLACALGSSDSNMPLMVFSHTAQNGCRIYHHRRPCCRARRQT
jgi:hypothetical protein